MNILLTTISLSSKTGGGTTERTRQLARHLMAQGHRCTLAAMEDGDRADELRGLGIPVYVAPVVTLRFRMPLIRFGKLAGMVRAADVVHILGYWNLLSIATAWLATLFGRPYVFSAAGEFAVLENPRPIARLFHHLLGERMIRHAARIIAITPLERQQIIDRFGFAPERVVVVPNGVGAGPPQEPTSISLPDAPFVLFVGRLATIKGPDLLLEAFAGLAEQHRDVILVLAGPDFGMGSQLRADTARLGIQNRVVFTGHLGDGDRTAAYRKALLLAVPSRDEAMSLVALEAGIAGTPVLVTDRCGFDEVARIGGGHVVSASVTGLRDGLLTMLDRRNELPAWGERLRRHVEETYCWEAIVQDLIALLERLIRPSPHDDAQMRNASKADGVGCSSL